MSAIEIENLTKDYPVGFWRKRLRRGLDGLTLWLPSPGRRLVRGPGRPGSSN